MRVFRHQYGQKGIALLLIGVFLFSLLPLHTGSAQTFEPDTSGLFQENEAGFIMPTPPETTQDGSTAGGGGTAGGGATASAADDDGDSETFSDADPTWLERKIFEVVVGAFGWLAIAGGSIMDFGINRFVRQYGSYYNDNFGGAIELVWEAVRDLVNLLLIFGLIYIGFRFILDSDDSSAKRNLVALIIAALLVNFSLFFAKAIVDISHVAANNFESALTDGTGDGVSGRFVNVLQLTAVFELNQEAELDEITVRRGFLWGTIFIIAICLLISAFVFAAIGVLLAIRFIVISFLLMFSPLMVAGMIFPNLRGVSSSWLNTLLKQSFIAPAIFLTLYVSLLILSALQSQVGAEFITHTSEALPFYILGMGFIIGSLVIAQKMGGYGASGAMSMGRAGAKKLRVTVQRGVVGGAARGASAAGRRSVGALGSAAVRRGTFSHVANQKGVTGFMGRKALLASDTARKSTFDARNTTLGSMAGGGKGTKLTHEDRQKQINEKDQRVASLIAEGEAAHDQVYKDNQVENVHEEHNRKLSERDEAIVALANTGSDQEAERQRLTQEIHQLNQHIKSIQKPEDATIAKNPKPASFTGTDAQWEAKLAEYNRYAAVRDDIKNTIQNQYAATLAQRGQGATNEFNQAINDIYRWVVRSPHENTTAANSIRKETSKKNDDRLLDALKNMNKDGE